MQRVQEDWNLEHDGAVKHGGPFRAVPNPFWDTQPGRYPNASSSPARRLSQETTASILTMRIVPEGVCEEAWLGRTLLTITVRGHQCEVGGGVGMVGSVL